MNTTKRSVSVVVMLILVFVLAAVTVTDSHAEQEAKSELAKLPIIDGSYLIEDAESTGTTTPMTRGQDLMTGYSKVRRLGAEEIYAGGTTIASHTVARIGVAVIVERAKEGDTSWEFWESWQKFNENTDRVASSKQLKVEGGYYYRVRCLHSAGEDMSSSFTDGVYVQTELGL